MFGIVEYQVQVFNRWDLLFWNPTTQQKCGPEMSIHRNTILLTGFTHIVLRIWRSKIIAIAWLEL